MLPFPCETPAAIRPPRCRGHLSAVENFGLTATAQQPIRIARHTNKPRTTGPNRAPSKPTSRALLRAGFAGNRHYPPSWVEAANSPGQVVIGSATPVSASQWSFCRTGGRASARPPGIQPPSPRLMPLIGARHFRPADRRCGTWAWSFLSQECHQLDRLRIRPATT